MFDSLRPQRLLALFAAGWGLLNLPLIALWDQPVRLGGVPLFPLALFVGWGVLIAAAAWVAERADDGDEPRDAAPLSELAEPSRLSVLPGDSLPPNV